MDVRDLRVFLAVLDEGSFAAAGRRMRLSPATVTERVQALERVFGAPLLVRSPLLPTAAGTVLVAFARRIVDDLDAALAAVADLSDAGDGRLRIGLFAGGAAELNPPLMRGLDTVLPHVAVSFVDLPLADTEAAVVEGRVDVAVLRSPVGHPRLRSVQLFLTHRVAMMSASHRLGGADQLSTSDLAEVTFTGVHPRHSAAFREFFLLTPARNWDAPVRVLRADSLADAYFHIVNHGAVATPSADAVRISPAPGVRAIPIVDAPPSGPVAVSRVDDGRREVRAFMAVAAKVAATCQSLVPHALPLPSRS